MSKTFIHLFHLPEFPSIGNFIPYFSNRNETIGSALLVVTRSVELPCLTGLFLTLFIHSFTHQTFSSSPDNAGLPLNIRAQEGSSKEPQPGESSWERQMREVMVVMSLLAVLKQEQDSGRQISGLPEGREEAS